MNPKDYAQLLYEASQQKTPRQQEEILGRFKNILMRNKESYLAPAIEKELNRIQAQGEQEKTTYISSASKLSPRQKKELADLFKKPREFFQNPNLLGGIAVRKKDRVYNATLRKTMESLKSLL